MPLSIQVYKSTYMYTNQMYDVASLENGSTNLVLLLFFCGIHNCHDHVLQSFFFVSHKCPTTKQRCGNGPAILVVATMTAGVDEFSSGYREP